MNEEEHIPAASRPEVTSPENSTVPQTTVEDTSPGRETPEAPEEEDADQVSATPPTPAAETAPPPATEVRAPATPPTTAEPDPAAATVTQSTTPPPTSVQETEHPTVPDRPDPRMRKPALYKPRMDPGQTRFRPRQSMSDISLADIHYKNVDVLTRFIDGQGRILPRRKTRISAKMQRRVKTAIKQARHLAMLPYTPTHIRSARRR